MFAELEELEKMLRDMSGEKQETSGRSASITEMTIDDKPREFRVDVAHEFSEQQPLHQVLNNLFTSPANLFHMRKKSRQQVCNAIYFYLLVLCHDLIDTFKHMMQTRKRTFNQDYHV